MKTNFRVAVRSLVFASALAVGLPAQADAQADLRGDWVLSLASSELGQSPTPDSAFLSIEASGEKLVMTGVRYYAQRGVTRNTWFDMRIDGEVHPVKTDDGGTLVRSIDLAVPGMGEDHQVMEYARKE